MATLFRLNVPVVYDVTSTGLTIQDETLSIAAPFISVVVALKTEVPIVSFVGGLLTPVILIYILLVRFITVAV
jgi:hypothetical protein